MGSSCSMRNVKRLCLGLFLLPTPLWAQTVDHTLTIDGTEHNLSLDAETRLKLPDGREITVLLQRKAFSRFEKDGIGFDYPSSISIASSEKDGGVSQHIGVSALGTLVLTQHHDNTDMVEFLDLLYNKMLEEQIALKIPIDKTPLTVTLADGTVLNGIRAHYAAADDDVTMDMITHAKGSGGYVMLTMHDNASAPAEIAIVEQFWKTLKLE